MTKTGQGAKPSTRKPSYSAPALEKGLDVLELLADRSDALNPSQIAQLLGRSVQEIYRIVVVLERRGYLHRSPREEGLVLSPKLMELAMRFPAIRRMHLAAQVSLNTLVQETWQAVHMAMLDGLNLRIVLQIDSPAPLGVRIRIGTEDAALRGSGPLLIAYQPKDLQAWYLKEYRALGRHSEADNLERRIQEIRGRGFDVADGEMLLGVTDLRFPICDDTGAAQASLTMPYLLSRKVVMPRMACMLKLRQAAADLSAMLGGTPPPVDETALRTHPLLSEQPQGFGGLVEPIVRPDPKQDPQQDSEPCP